MNIAVRPSPGRGRGVFAVDGFRRGETIEEAPVLVVACDTWWVHECNRVLLNYSFQWEFGQSAVVLGCGSLYNHSYDPNAVYLQDLTGMVMRFTAVKKIAAGEEIFINYGGTGGTRRMKFEVK